MKSQKDLNRAVLRVFLEDQGVKLNDVELDDMATEFETELNLIFRGLGICISSQLIKRKLQEN